MACLIPTLPTFDDIAKAFANIKLPPLPTLPTPIFANLRFPTVELQHWIAEVQNIFYGGLVLSILKPMCALLALDFSKIIPKLPGLDVTIIDFVEGNYTKIKNSITTAIKNKVTAFTSLFPPLFGSLHMIEVEIAHMMQTIFSMGIQTVVGIIVSLTQPVINVIANLGTVIASIKVPTIPSLTDIASNIATSVKNKLKSIRFPGFPDITLPDFGKIIAPTLQIIKAMPMIIIGLLLEVLKPIQKFVNDISAFIGGFRWPKLCVNESGFYLG